MATKISLSQFLTWDFKNLEGFIDLKDEEILKSGDPIPNLIDIKLS